MEMTGSDTWMWLLRIVFAVLLVTGAAWTVRDWRREPQLRLHCISHVAMAGGMLYMTLPTGAGSVPLGVLAPAYVALAVAVVSAGLRDRRDNDTPGMDVCIACAPVAAGSLGAAYMVLMPAGALLAAPLALSFGVAGALRGGAALAVAVDEDVAHARLVTPRSGTCPGCCCGPDCSCGRPAPPARRVALQQASASAMNLAMAVMLVAMSQPSGSMHM
ncbi:MAG: DUF5134 domain-containing protein [Thermoleophilia bacterium]|nr:DUF5134 domain-containing protein [Thermoleophilia bacterium]